MSEQLCPSREELEVEQIRAGIASEREPWEPWKAMNAASGAGAALATAMLARAVVSHGH